MASYFIGKPKKQSDVYRGVKGNSVCFCLKGKPPTKKAKVLQKQPLVTKMVPFTQYQTSTQGGVKKSGEHGPKADSRGRTIRHSFAVRIKIFQLCTSSHLGHLRTNLRCFYFK